MAQPSPLARGIRKCPYEYAEVAQLVEQCFRKAKVVGSIPTFGSSLRQGYGWQAMRMSYNGIILASQASEAGPIPVIRSRIRANSMGGRCGRPRYGIKKF